MIIRGGYVFFQDMSFSRTDIGVTADRITSVVTGCGEELDCEGKYVLPGLVDIHLHGAKGYDFCTGTPEADAKIAEYEAYEGVTSFLGTSMTGPEETLTNAFSAARKYMENTPDNCAVMRGINMEGPFISKEKRGAQPGEQCIPFDRNLFKRLWKASGESVKILDMCPEYPGNTEAMKELSSMLTVSLAHTNASYDIAKAAFANGATHVTHLFNGMSPFAHRDPGVVGAAAEDAKQVELICDGVHIHPSMIRTMFRLFGGERICMISDSTAATGMQDGTYKLGNEDIFLCNGKALLKDGTLAGATTCLTENLRRCAGFGVPLEQVFLACTYTPARAIGIEKEVGSVRTGSRADLLILNEDLSTYAVILGGKRIR